MYMTVYGADGPGVINRTAGPTIGIVSCQHLVVTKDGAINDHDCGVAVSIDAATLECSVTKTGRRKNGRMVVPNQRGHTHFVVGVSSKRYVNLTDK